MMEEMTGAQAIVRCMELENIDHVFCVPGESYLALLDAIYDSNIRLISARHESGAAFMAESYAKASGRPGVAMATRGVGASNLAIGVHTAHQDSTPMVVFLGQVHSQFRGREGFQEVDLDRFFAPISKWAVEVRDVERIPEIVQRAFRIARTGRPGPVVVSLPEDVLKQTGSMRFGPPVRVPRPRPSDTEIEEMIRLINRSTRPLILAGGGVIWSEAEKELRSFAEKMNIPVMASFRRHDVFPNDHPLYVGHSGLGPFPDIVDTIRQADTILAIGTRFSEVTTQGYSVIGGHQTLIHIDIDYETIGKIYPPTLGIVADAKEALKTLIEALKRRSISSASWRKWALERRRVYESCTGLKCVDTSSELDNRQIIKVLQEELPPDAILTNDAGNFSGWLHNFFQFTRRRTYVGPTSGAMGYGLPSAIGAKLAYPDRTVVTLAGDGGFTMTMHELETAVRYNIPVVTLIFNNNMYGTIRMHQEKHYPGRVIGTILTNFDFVKIAESMNIFGVRVRTAEYFRKALKEAINLNKPSLIEIQTNPYQISVHSMLSKSKGLIKAN